MHRLIISLSLSLGFSMASVQASLTTNEILTRLQNCIEENRPTTEIEEGLIDLSNKELSLLLKEYDATWPKLRDAYYKSFQTHAQSLYSGDAKLTRKRSIKNHREQFISVYLLGERAMKNKLSSISMPALQELRKLLMPRAQETLATAPNQLKSRRKIVHLLANFRDAIVDAIVIPDQVESLVAVLEFEKQTVSALSDLPQDGLRTIKKNDEIALKSQIPKKEREGIREVNEWRLLLGLNALDLDPKLCEASRGHSEDMYKHKFFAHESPIAGKETPWKRAAEAGTKATGENIYMGSQVPASANKGWFFSPGHHKNMFKNSHIRIGLGQYKQYWTQMFG